MTVTLDGTRASGAYSSYAAQTLQFKDNSYSNSIHAEYAKYEHSVSEDEAEYTSEDLDIYLEGEAEIKKQVQLKLATVMDLNFDAEAYEKEVREQYAQEHPEYAAVYKHYLKIEQQAQEYIESKLEEWEKEHPIDPLGTISTLAAHEQEKEQYRKTLIEDYANQNEEYKQLYQKQTQKEQQAKENSPLNQFVKFLKGLFS